jgi:hypothetical protein
MQSDRGHIHHRLLDHGLSVRQTTILLYGVCGVFCLFGILLLSPRRSFASLIFSILGVLIVIGVQRLRYPEFEVLGSKIRQGVTRRRRRLIANINVRQLGATMKQAITAEKIFTFLNELGEINGFDGITLEINAQIRPQISALLNSGAEAKGWKPVLSSIPTSIWGCARNAGAIDELMAAESAWSLRIPLRHQNRELGVMTLYRFLDNSEVFIDFNSICGYFHQELSQALDKLLQQVEANPEDTVAESSLIECQ